MRSRASMSELLGSVRNDQTLLVPIDNREIVSFTVSLVRPMGLKRLVGKRSFIDSVLDTIDDFYGDVVQYLREWQPAAPKLKKRDVEEIVSQPLPPGKESKVTAANPPENKDGGESNSSISESEPNNSVKDTGATRAESSF